MAIHLTQKLISSKKRALINKKAKLRKITIIKKAKSLQKRKKKILMNKKAKFKKMMLLKKRKKIQRLGDKKAHLKERAEQRRRRHKRRKKRERSRRELQLVSGDTVSMPAKHAIETVESVKEVETQPVDYVSGEQYNSIFAGKVETPIQVDSQLWDSIKENLPDNYMIPDPDFLEAVTVDDLPEEIYSGKKPALLQPIDASSETSLSEPELESQSQSTKEEMVWKKPQSIDDTTESE